MDLNHKSLNWIGQNWDYNQFCLCVWLKYYGKRG